MFCFFFGMNKRSQRLHFRHPTVLPLRAGPADDKSNEKLRRASPESYHPVARVDDTLATLRIETVGMRPCSSVTLYAARRAERLGRHGIDGLRLWRMGVHRL